MKLRLLEVTLLGALMSTGTGGQLSTATGAPSAAPLSGRVHSSSGEPLGGSASGSAAS